MSNPGLSFNRRIRDRAAGYVLIREDLYKKGKDDLLLKYVSLNEATLVMAEVHEGIYGAHQAGPKMRWLIRRYGYHCPSVMSDCVKYTKGCWACQTHGPVQRLPAAEFNPVVKPWPFQGWAMDLIGKILPPATWGHCFIIVATDYFTKWVEAVPMKGVSQTELIQFLKCHIIHRFGLPETVTCDNGSVFVGDEVVTFVAELGITFTHSTPYYAQGNGQAEASNNILKRCLSKVVDDNPQQWADMLSEVLWALRTSQRSSITTTPFALTYGHDVVLPVEVSVRSARVVFQQGLSPTTYNEAMMAKLDDLEEDSLAMLDRMQVQKKKIAAIYNKTVSLNHFQNGDLVLKIVLPVGAKDPRLGKWSPTWEGPFTICQVLKGRAYRL
ncbi:uncharacterized protein LOC122650670 [Telopea speciosissima]|uniref:uncharacterized protein LOC122650670 n=1 Tax=Telopea speciosissima TaxID=54955 RepID=UPI001CC652C4|nr:uncharacterized protein LOC122650670 [Telopea speciosissima]